MIQMKNRFLYGCYLYYLLHKYYSYSFVDWNRLIIFFLPLVPEKMSEPVPVLLLLYYVPYVRGRCA